MMKPHLASHPVQVAPIAFFMMLLLCRAAKGQSFMNRQDCDILAGGHGASFAEIENVAQTYGYLVDQDIVDRFQDSATYGLSVCKINPLAPRSDKELEFYLTQAIREVAGGDEVVIDFGCIAVYQGQMCSE